MTDKEFKKLLINNMIKILKSGDISAYSKEHIIDMYCWLLTERKPFKNDSEKTKNAKFKGCDYWSQAALDILYKTKDIKGLRHEHVVPRSLFREYVKECVKYNKALDVDKISDYFIGCVVTAEEAGCLDTNFKDKMPDDLKFENIDEENLWNRYKKTNEIIEEDKIKVVKVKWTFQERGWGAYKVEKEII